MTSTAHRALLTATAVLAGLTAAALPAPSHAQAIDGFPDSGHGRSCQLPGGTIIKDGSTIVTSNGTEIYCIDGVTCRWTRSGVRQGCRSEPARSPQRQR